ncbi:phosphohistidine phosphatase SixA [Halorhodospira halochloris]|uniref:Phosphohistidine phosphatase SixA n=1 Tax=Halorhodospira halochloris TaxID=1052 RepID=A0A110B4V2_HALHR|nr:histidine phosphatase family protein [Halorhodospira halochloris]MBK1652995.1 hypothetical protein [Halorhodospira halochloris]BAU57356.1 phosphohistidine phosphatase SixA [Halorhodospira halochloris]
MKELLIIRHAKSSWYNPHLNDKERPLAPRGEKAAPMMAQRLVQRGAIPQLIVTSEAVRAQQTARLMAAAMGLDDQLIVLDKRLYNAGPAEWLEIIRDQPDTYQRIALIGHNPAIEETARSLFSLQVAKVPTAAVITVRFGCDRWVQVDPKWSEVVGFDYPKRRG